MLFLSKLPQAFLKRFYWSQERKNTLYSLIGLGGRFIFRALYFIIIARALGAAGFGLFSGVLGFVFILYPFADWGSGLLMIRSVSRNPDAFGIMWGTSLTIMVVMGALFCGVSVIASWIVLSSSIALTVVLPVSVGVLWGFRATELAAQAFQAHQSMKQTSIIWLATSILRLVAALIFLLQSYRIVTIWALVFMMSELLGGFFSVLWVMRELGWGIPGFQGIRGSLLDGFSFSVSVAATGVYNDLDKTLLVRFGDPAIAGAYTAAYRFLDAFYIPVQAIVISTFARYFQVGLGGLEQTWVYTRRLLPYTLIIALGAWTGMFAIAPVLPKLLGMEYILTPVIATYLGPVVIFRSIHTLLANSLSGANRHKMRSSIQVSIALVNLSLNLWWIPRYGWWGALWSSILSDGLMVFSLLSLTLVLIKVQGKRSEND